jgi:anti-anti-sigma factor
MELSVSHENGYVLGRIDGVIDDSAEAPFRELLHPLVRQRGTKVVLDLSGAPRITSAGIAQLVLLTTNANTSNSRVVLTGATPFIVGVFSVSKLDRFFEQAESLSQALDRLAAPA